MDECVSLGALTCAGVNWIISNSRCFLKNPGYGGKYMKPGVNCVEISCLENNRKSKLKKYPTLYLFFCYRTYLSLSLFRSQRFLIKKL